jgi:hypothetical protein
MRAISIGQALVDQPAGNTLRHDIASCICQDDMSSWDSHPVTSAQDLQLCDSRRIPKPYWQLVARITNKKKFRNSIDCRTVALPTSMTPCRFQVQHMLVVVLLHNVEEDKVLNPSLPRNPNPKPQPPPLHILLLEEQYVGMLYRLCVLVSHRNFS